MKSKKQKSASVLAWHFLPASGRTRYSNETVEVGSVLHADGALELCANGLHASRRVTDALRHAPGWIICRVELDDEILEGEDKLCARSRRVIAMADASKIIMLFLADCAERALRRIKNPDQRSLDAVQAVRDFASAKIGAAKLRDFRAAAWDARKTADAAAAAAAYAYADAADAAAAAAAADADAAAAAAAYAYAYADAAAAAAAAYAYAYADAAAAKTPAERRAAALAASASARQAECDWQEETLSSRLLELLGLKK